MRWMVVLSDYDFKIKCINGKENTIGDALDRSIQMIYLTFVNSFAIDLNDKI